MEKGFNSDIQIGAQKFHIQTEDWGMNKKMVVSTIFKNGAVVQTHKVSYEDIFKDGSVRTTDAIRLALRRLHHDIIEKLKELNSRSK